MSVAICVFCGNVKQGAFTPCPTCKRIPITEIDLTYSVALSTHCMPVERLQAASAELRQGSPRIVLPPEQKEYCRKIARMWMEDPAYKVIAGSRHAPDARHPPFSQSQPNSGQASNERMASSKRSARLSRNTVRLIVSIYFFVALALAVFLEMRKPLATWTESLDASSFGAIIGAALGLFFASGTIPIVVWAFRRFRIKKASGPLYTWLVLLFIFGFLSVYGRSIEENEKIEEVIKTLLIGENRKDFIAGARQSCIETERKRLVSNQVKADEALLSEYCGCFANALASDLSSDEIHYFAQFGKPSTTTRQKIEVLGRRCIRELVKR